MSLILLFKTSAVGVQPELDKGAIQRVDINSKRVDKGAVEAHSLNVKVIPTTKALTLATFAPTVTVASNDVTVTPTTAALTLATFAPTVTTPQTVTPSTLALTLATFAPTVTTPVLATPTTVDLTLATFAPTVSTPQVVTPTTADLTLATFAPTVSTPVVATPTTTSLSLTMFAPTVSTPVTVTPSTTTLTLGTFAPTVSTPVVCTPTTAALIETTYAPTVTATANVTVTPTTVAFALTAFAPTVTVSSGVTVVPTTATLTIATSAPTVTATANVLATPTTASLTLNTFTPTVATPRNVVPTTATLTLTAFAPTVSTPVVATPTTLGLSLTIFAPTVTVTANVLATPTTAVLVLTEYAPTVTASGSVLVTPTTRSLVTTTFAPTVAVADYIIHNDTEWNSAMASATAGDLLIIAGTNFTERIVSKSGLTISSLDSEAALPRLVLDGTINGLTLLNLNLQMTGWPRTYTACLGFNSGPFSDIVLDGVSFRHGYGVSSVDFDITANLSEYTRVDNVHTATTTTATYALTWQDAAATAGISEFFNRGANNVYVKFGGSGVTATAGDTLVTAGGYLRFNGLNPTSDTHVAILAASGTSETNARAEIGLGYYLADAFSSFGETIDGLTIRNCTFRDLNNGIKQFGNASSHLYIHDNDVRRIYQDIVAGVPAANTPMYVVRNTWSVPFCRSGIPENQTGDASDPHGDTFQTFSDGTNILGPIYSAGNRQFSPTMRTTAGGSGIFIATNNINPAYDLLFSIGDIIICRAYAGISFSASATYPMRSGYVYGSTCVRHDDLDNNEAARLHVGTTEAVIIENSIVHNEAIELGQVVKLNTLYTMLAANANAVFPDIADLATATDRASIELAMTTAGEGAGLGAVAHTNTIDWVTTDPLQIINWENVPAGIWWDNAEDVTPSLLYHFPARRVLNRKTAQTVVPGSGVEWRTLSEDGVTGISPWSSGSGTIEPSQYIRIRKAASANPFTETIAQITVNGFTTTVTITTLSSVTIVSDMHKGAVQAADLGSNKLDKGAVEKADVVVNTKATPLPTSLWLTSYAPTVSNGNKYVVPSTAALSLATFAPTVTATANVLVTPTTDSLTLTRFAPSVTVGDAVEVVPANATLVLTTFPPMVSTPQTVTPTTANLVLTSYVATILTPVTVTPTTATLVLTTYAPTLGNASNSWYYYLMST